MFISVSSQFNLSNSTPKNIFQDAIDFLFAVVYYPGGLHAYSLMHAALFPGVYNTKLSFINLGFVVLGHM